MSSHEENYGNALDLEAWVKEGLVDTLVGYNDKITPKQEGESAEYFVSLTKNSPCKCAINLMPRYLPPEVYKRRADALYRAGVDHLFFWDSHKRINFDASWSAIRRLGHKEELAQWRASGGPAVDRPTNFRPGVGICPTSRLGEAINGFPRHILRLAFLALLGDEYGLSRPMVSYVEAVRKLAAELQHALMIDGMHPNTVGHTMISDALMNVIGPMLGAPTNRTTTLIWWTNGNYTRRVCGRRRSTQLCGKPSTTYPNAAPSLTKPRGFWRMASPTGIGKAGCPPGWSLSRDLQVGRSTLEPLSRCWPKSR